MIDYQYEFLIREYEKLKDEQHKRIEFRDQMIYLTLAAIGTVFSFALEKPTLNIALLVLPFVCIIMGWTYLANDEKISAIAIYLRRILIPRINKIIASEESQIINHWEQFAHQDNKRKFRKAIQLMIDLSTFAISSFVALLCFFLLHQQIFWYHLCIAAGEIIALVCLIILFFESSGN